MDADYVTGGIDTTINKYADTTGVIFGHSDALNEKCGFWVFVLTMGVKNAGHYAQLAIGSLGHASREYSPDTGWSTWV